MSKLLKIFNSFLFIVLLSAFASTSFAQHKKKLHRSTKDSLRHTILKRDSLLRTFKHSDNSLNDLLQKIELYTSSYKQDSSELLQGFVDTLGISSTLPTMERRMTVMSTLIQNDRSSSLGYLFTIRDLLEHFKDRLDDWQKDLTDDNAMLEKILGDADDFKKDSTMHTVPTDSVLRAKSMFQILSIQKKWIVLTGRIQKDLIKIGLLQNRVTNLDLAMFDINDAVDQKLRDFRERALTDEYGLFWERNTKNMASLDSVWSKTFRLNSKLLKYFFDVKTTSHVNIISHIAFIVILFSLFAWIFFSKRKLRNLKDDHVYTFDQTQYIVKRSFVSSLLVATTLALYFYDQPPFIFLELLLLLMTLCIGVLIWPIWPKSFFKFWLALFLLLGAYATTNLFTQICDADRIFLLILSLASVAAGLWFLISTKKKTEIYPPHTKLFIGVFTALEFTAFILNLIGRFSLAKILGVATVFNICLGFGFYLFLEIIMESLFLQLEANKNVKNSVISYIDFNVIQRKFKAVLVKIVIVLWLVELLENLYIDDYIYGKASDFLNHPYKFGTAAVSIGSLVIFIFVIWLSIIIAQVINYFYDFAEQQSNNKNDVKKTRTSILLIRLSVFSLGFIAAITFSGIPLSQVTIVIGALGVGIGFGLQNIVNNLVSGVILAFEKPVQVGDIIEVGDKSGVIKEIGIRASKIEAGNGSELIIPNGDLISQHVINWTLTNNNRQIELIVGVAYGSDIAKVDALLKRILKNRKDLMQIPAPSVYLHNFSDSSVDFRMFFWAADIKNWVSLKSNVMIEIYTEFTKEGIEIPHPKRDIQVFFPEGTSADIRDPDVLKEIFPKEESPEKSTVKKNRMD